MEIREAGPDEYPAVGDLVVQAYATLEGGHLDDGYAAEIGAVAQRAESTEILVAVEGGLVLGTATYVPGPGPYAEVDDPEAAGMRMLAVDASARGRGVGQALVEECVRRAHIAGRPRLILHTTPWMTAAHALYERLGFRRTPEHDHPEPVYQLRAYTLDLPVN